MPYGLLGATLLLSRLFQTITLIPIIGMTANFIAEIVGSGAKAPSILIGVISVTCILTIYTIITTILFHDNILPFLSTALLDTLFLIAVIVVAVLIGKPLSYLNCTSSAYAFASKLDSYLDDIGVETRTEYGWIWSRSACLEVKAVWGLFIALCILLFFSVTCCVCLWRQKKKESAGAEKLDG